VLQYLTTAILPNTGLWPALVAQSSSVESKSMPRAWNLQQ